MNDIERNDPDWLTKLNANFETLLDKPFPMAGKGSLPASKYEGCLALVGGRLEVSDGSVWSELRGQLTFIADLDTGTATIEDVKNAYNSLLADMQSKGWML